MALRRQHYWISASRWKVPEAAVYIEWIYAGARSTDVNHTAEFCFLRASNTEQFANNIDGLIVQWLGRQT